jgi:TonB family protein
MPHSYNKSVGEPTGMFQSLEFQGSRKRSFWTSLGMHGGLLAALLLLQLMVVEPLHLKPYDLWMLEPPPPARPVLEVTHWKLPPPVPVKPPEKRVETPPLPIPTPPKPEPIRPPEVKPQPNLLPKPEIAELPKPLPKPRMPELPPAPVAPPPPKPVVKTDVFGDTAKATTTAPSRQVQTGGFGDEHGIKGDGRPDKAANISSLGSFDLPVGKGAGNGTGGAHGTPGIVAGAGFDSGAPGGKRGNSGPSQTVHDSGFGDSHSAPSQPSGGGGRAHSQQGALEFPAEILFKPKPDYTEEARHMKIEGEVLLRVLFTAGGEVRVLETVSSLGHGLDENAVKSARQIRFKPATREGKPVDSTAVVHIVFQLAY